jgi:hypothetical protein
VPDETLLPPPAPGQTSFGAPLPVPVEPAAVPVFQLPANLELKLALPPKPAPPPTAAPTSVVLPTASMEETFFDQTEEAVRAARQAQAERAALDADDVTSGLAPRILLAAAGVALVLGYLGVLVAWVLTLRAGTVEERGASWAPDARRLGALSGGALFFSALLWAIGWIWWLVVASRNGRRFAVGTMSAWWTPIVYLGIPIGGVFALSAAQGLWMTFLVTVSVAITFLVGHLAVISGCKGIAKKVFGTPSDFSRLVWVPVIWGVVRAASLAISNRASSWEEAVWFLIGGTAIDVIFSALLAKALWVATTSLDAAFERKARMGNGLAAAPTTMPPAMASAIAALRARTEAGS